MNLHLISSIFSNIQHYHFKKSSISLIGKLKFIHIYQVLCGPQKSYEHESY